jgi:chromosome partitioning protein
MAFDREAGATMRPRVVVIGNHKGGCGKSTIAMHVIIALLAEGHRVASFDLDLEQLTLTRYLENRRAWGHLHGVALSMPDHHSVEEVTGTDFGRNDVGDATGFATALARLGDRYDFVVIDTPSGSYHIGLIAHSMADVLVTPLNDSFIDLDLIGTMAPSADLAPRRSRYLETVARAAELRRQVSDAPTDWVVIRNRMSSQFSRNGRQVADMLEAMASEIGFRLARGLTERIIFREFFPVGLTAFDPLDEKLLGLRPGMAHLMARGEVRDLISDLGLLTPKIAPDAPDDTIRQLVRDLRLPRAPQLTAVSKADRFDSHA